MSIFVREGPKSKPKEVDVDVKAIQGFLDLQGEMNRIFEQTLGGLRRNQDEQQLIEWPPAADVSSRGEDLLIRLELPGINKEEVDITLHERVLTISGEHTEEQEQSGERSHSREMRRGSFKRSMVLPEGTTSSDISARFEDGVLEVSVKGAGGDSGEPERIQIEGPEQ